MKSLIVDDEPLARRELRRLLAEFPWIEIVGEAGDVGEAAARIETLAPDLLFLDIQMPGGSGFDLLARLDHLPHVIFTTAYDHHAVRESLLLQYDRKEIFLLQYVLNEFLLPFSLHLRIVSHKIVYYQALICL